MMKKKLVTSLLLLVVICLSFSATAFAETTPTNEEVIPTVPVIATETPINTDAPVDTGVATDPYIPTDTIDTGASDTTPTDYSEPQSSEATASTETTAPVSTAPVTNPTEPDEDSTYSDYVSPDPIYTPADQDFEENDWQEIELNLEAAPSNGKGNFDFIQKNNTKGNDSIAGFLIVGLVLIFLSIAGFTFVILYRPYKKKASVTTGARHTEPRKAQPKQSRTRTNSDNRRIYNPDDYNDGF